MPNTPDPQTAKAEALLLHFAAEAHRRKWAYDRGLDDDGVPIKSEAFDALHRLGEEMRTALEELRRLAAVVPSAAETTNRAALYREAAEQLLASDLGPRPGHTEDYGNGWSDATLRAQSYLLGLAQTADGSRVAAEEQPAETQDGRAVGRLATALREVLATFAPMRETNEGPVAYYDGSADIEPEQFDRWRAALDGVGPCACIHPADEHTVYGCADDCGCTWMPKRPAVGEQPDTQTREADLAARMVAAGVDRNSPEKAPDGP